MSHAVLSKCEIRKRVGRSDDVVLVGALSLLCRHILAVKEASELIRFEYTIFPPGQEGLDGEKSKLRVTVNRPQISVVMMLANHTLAKRNK